MVCIIRMTTRWEQSDKIIDISSQISNIYLDFGSPNMLTLRSAVVQNFMLFTHIFNKEFDLYHYFSLDIRKNFLRITAVNPFQSCYVASQLVGLGGVFLGGMSKQHQECILRIYIPNRVTESVKVIPVA